VLLCFIGSDERAWVIVEEVKQMKGDISKPLFYSTRIPHFNAERMFISSDCDENGGKFPDRPQNQRGVRRHRRRFMVHFKTKIMLRLSYFSLESTLFAGNSSQWRR
jgi:hypothetical protein